MMQKPKILAADNTKVALRYMETILGDIYDVTLVQTGMSVLDLSLIHISEPTRH